MGLIWGSEFLLKGERTGMGIRGKVGKIKQEGDFAGTNYDHVL